MGIFTQGSLERSQWRPDLQQRRSWRPQKQQSQQAATPRACQKQQQPQQLGWFRKQTEPTSEEQPEQPLPAQQVSEQIPLQIQIPVPAQSRRRRRELEQQPASAPPRKRQGKGQEQGQRQVERSPSTSMAPSPLSTSTAVDSSLTSPVRTTKLIDRRRHKANSSLLMQIPDNDLAPASREQLCDMTRNLEKFMNERVWMQPPAMDLNEWKSHCSPAEILECTQLMETIKLKVKQSRDACTAGQWTRHERNHGRLRLKHGNSPWAHAVANGAKLFPKYLPPQKPIPPMSYAPNRLKVLQACMRRWINDGIAVPISEQKHQEFRAGNRYLYFMQLLLIKKPGKEQYYEFNDETVLDKWRPCVNGADLNELLMYTYFKRITQRQIDAKARQGMWAVKSDLTSAFQIISASDEPMDETRFGLTSTRDLLCFKVDAVLPGVPAAPFGFQMIVNTFGISPAPLILDKPYSLVMSELSQEGVRTVTICDDNMVLAYSPVQVLRDLQLLVDRHIYYGLPLSSKNLEEDITPTSYKVMNGIGMCFKSMRKFLPVARVKKMLGVLSTCIRQKTIRVRLLSSLLGQIQSAAPALFGVHLFTAGIKTDLVRGLRQSMVNGIANYDQTVQLSPQTLIELRFLLEDQFRSFQGKIFQAGQKVAYHLQSDFSGIGAGAVVFPDQLVPLTEEMSVPFPPSFRKVWSGVGETMVGALAIRAAIHHRRWEGGLIQIELDNVYAVSVHNRLGSTNANLNSHMLALQSTARLRNLQWFATWCEGKTLLADTPSRRVPHQVYDACLKWEIFQQLEWLLLLKPHKLAVTFDLMATFVNTKAALYGSLQLDPGAAWVDSMLQSWEMQPPHKQHVYYAFPPPMLVEEMLTKIKTERATVLLILPVTTKTNHAALAEIAMSEPVFFPWNSKTCQDPLSDQRTKAPVYETGNWVLTGVLTSGVTCWCKVNKRKMLRRSSIVSKGTNITFLTEYGMDSSAIAKAETWQQHFLRAMKRSLQSNLT